MNACWVKENVLWRNNISFKEDTGKVVLRDEKVFCTFLSSTKHPFEGYKIMCIKAIGYARLKMGKLISSTEIWFIISEKSMRCTFLHCGAYMQQKFQQQDIPKNSVSKFQALSALKLPSCEVMVFHNMNTYQIYA